MLSAPAPAPVPAPPPGGYSARSIQVRIGVYVAIAALMNASSGLIDLASMNDQQLAAITPLRWTLKGLILVVAISLAGLNAFRAAIDRSTASPGTPLPGPEDPAPILARAGATPARP